MFSLKQIGLLKNLIMKPIFYQGLSITLLDVLPAHHNENWCVKTHFHPWFEWNYVESGAVYTTIDGTEFPVRGGQFYMIPPGIRHSHRNLNHTGDDGFCLRFQITKTEDSESGAEILSILSVPRPFATPLDLTAFLAQDFRFPFGQETALLCLLSALYSCFADSKPIKSRAQSANERLAEQALVYLEQYFAMDISPKEVALSLNISYRHLARVFKEYFGVSLVKKLNGIRINEAKRLLIETNLPIYEIAEKIGCQNEFYFSNLFRQYAFSTPSEFRKSNQR